MIFFIASEYQYVFVSHKLIRLNLPCIFNNQYFVTKKTKYYCCNTSRSEHNQIYIHNAISFIDCCKALSETKSDHVQ